MGQNVSLGQPAVDAGPVDHGRVQIVFLDKTPYRGRQRVIARRRRRRGLRNRRGHRFFAGLLRLDRRCLRGHRGVALVQDREAGANLDAGAFGGDDRSQRAGRRGRHLERHLVGLKLDNRLVCGHRVAGGLDPARHRRVSNGLAEGWDSDFNRHGVAASLCGAGTTPSSYCRRPAQTGRYGYVTRQVRARRPRACPVHACGAPGYRSPEMPRHRDRHR